MEEVMHGRPIWSLSAWSGFICALFALSTLMHGYLAGSALMMFGAVALFGWAAWLSHRER
jgi:hypothetical protein